jgi:hypothetical protein
VFREAGGKPATQIMAFCFSHDLGEYTSAEAHQLPGSATEPFQAGNH